MLRRPLVVACACVLLGAAIGWLALGPFLYTLPIGLDESAFLWGESLQPLAKWFARDPGKERPPPPDA